MLLTIKMAVLAGAVGMAATAAGAAEGLLRLELNRLEPAGEGCRVYLVVENGRAAALESLKLDLVLFGTDGVIDRRLAVEAGPLRAGRAAVKLFDLTGYPCEELGSVLLNDVLACGGAGEETPPDCMAGLVLATRVPGVEVR